MTLITSCKYCHKNNPVPNGVIFTDFDGATAKACWGQECQSRYKLEMERIQFRTQSALRSASQCVFHLGDAYCKKTVITGEYYCREHLTNRCCICGDQATRVCHKTTWTGCKFSVCAKHTHDHQYYY